MLRPRQSRVKFYEDMKEALAPSKVTPIKYARPPTSIGSGAEVAAKVGEEWLAAYLAEQKKDAEAADIKAAGAMLDKFYAPQEEWNEEEYGSTPDTLRAATMPGALTADVGSQEMPIESYGAMGPDGMPAALGAPNAALGAPIDIEQPYAVGADEEGDDANWMSAPEHAEFYKRSAAEAQTEFDAENVPGLPAVMKADSEGAYNTPNGVRGRRSDAMLAALRGKDSALKREEAERGRVADLLTKKREHEAGLLSEEQKFTKGQNRITRQHNLADTEEANRQAILLKQTPAPRVAVPGTDIPFPREVAEQRAIETAGKYKAQGEARAKADEDIRKAKPMPASAVKMQNDIVEKVQISQGLQVDMGAVLDLVQGGKMNLGLIQNLVSQGRQAVGMSDEASRNYGSFMAKLEKARNDSLRLNNGVQTEGDAQRAWKELMANLNDQKFVEQRLQEIGIINARAERDAKFRVSQIRREFDKEEMVWPSRPEPAIGGGSGSDSAIDALVEKHKSPGG